MLHYMRYMCVHVLELDRNNEQHNLVALELYEVVLDSQTQDQQVVQMVDMSSWHCDSSQVQYGPFFNTLS